jgi:hypothetical protein
LTGERAIATILTNPRTIATCNVLFVVEGDALDEAG